MQLAHLRIFNEIQSSIAAKVQQKITVERTLDEIRDTLPTEGIKRKHKVTRLDINNIFLLHNIKGIIKHSNDLSSVSAGVEEMKSFNYKPLLLFKQQGEEQLQAADNIETRNILLVVQTEFHRDVLCEFGKNTVCIDSTIWHKPV